MYTVSELSANAFFSQKSAASAVKPKKLSYKLEICNQDLNEAIRQVRVNVQQNPEWRLNVKNVTDNHSNNVNRIGSKNKLLLMEGKSFAVQSLDREGIDKANLQKLKYTDRLKQEYEDRIRMVKEKRRQLEIRSIERQIQAKLERKISEKSYLKQQRRMVQDLQQKRMESISVRQHIERRRQNEKELLHETSIAKVEMLRRHKQRSIKKELSENKTLSASSSLDLKFKEFQRNKSKNEEKELLKARYRSLRSSSEATMRRNKVNRQGGVSTQRGHLQVRPMQTS